MHVLQGAPLAAQFGRNVPAGIDAGHVRKLVGDPLVAIDAGLLAADQESRMDVGGALRLLREIHRDRGMAIPALERVVRL